MSGGKFVWFSVTFMAWTMAGLVGAGFLKSSSVDNMPPKYSIGAALRYLSKAVFTDALLQGSSTDEILGHLQSSSLQDSGDCVKRLICELQRQPFLNWDEQLILDAIPTRLDYASPILQLQLAANLGAKNPDQCPVVYSRCSFDKTDIMSLMRQRGTSLDLSTADGTFDCTVLFLWNKRQPKVEENETDGQPTTTEVAA